MAVTASKGSKQVRVFREAEERKNAQEKHWELAGSKLGNIMGIKVKPEEGAEAADTEAGADATTNAAASYKEAQQFATHLKDNEAVSSFALEKTMKQQREYLPVFAVRQKILRYLRMPHNSHCYFFLKIVKAACNLLQLIY